jgi:hypothetical protein
MKPDIEQKREDVNIKETITLRRLLVEPASGAKSLVSGSGVATDTVVNLENTVTVQARDSSG